MTAWTDILIVGTVPALLCLLGVLLHQRAAEEPRTAIRPRRTKASEARAFYRAGLIMAAASMLAFSIIFIVIGIPALYAAAFADGLFLLAFLASIVVYRRIGNSLAHNHDCGCCRNSYGFTRQAIPKMGSNEGVRVGPDLMFFD